MRESNFHIMASRSTVVEKHVKTLFQRDDFFTLIKCFSFLQGTFQVYMKFSCEMTMETVQNCANILPWLALK